MDSASTVEGNAHETAQDAAFKSAADYEADLQGLRQELRRLGEQIAGLLAESGNAAWRRAKSGLDDVVADAETKGREAAGAVREVSDHFVDALDESIKTRPYTTLALVAGIAFLFGATWRR